MRGAIAAAREQCFDTIMIHRGESKFEHSRVPLRLSDRAD
jgi:hypothetical protein